MKLQELMEKACLPEAYIPMNRWIKVDEAEILLVAIIRSHDEDVLWYFENTPTDYEATEDFADDLPMDDGFAESVTRREMLLQQIRNDAQSTNIHIKALTYASKSYRITTSQGQALGFPEPETFMAMQYLFEKGLDLTRWNDLDLNQIILHRATLEVVEDETVSANDCVTIDMRFNRVPLDDHLRFELKPDVPLELEYIHPITGKEETVYCSGLSWYDLWATWNAPFETEWAKTLPADELARMMSEHEKHLENICPKGQSLPLFAYESEDGVQLDAYPVDYLDGLFFDQASNEANAMAIMMNPDERIGPHGHMNFIIPLHLGKAPYEVEVIAIYDKKDEVVIPL